MRKRNSYCARQVRHWDEWWWGGGGLCWISPPYKRSVLQQFLCEKCVTFESRPCWCTHRWMLKSCICWYKESLLSADRCAITILVSSLSFLGWTLRRFWQVSQFHIYFSLLICPLRTNNAGEMRDKEKNLLEQSVKKGLGTGAVPN